MKKRVLAIIFLLSMITAPAIAEIDTTSMTDEELRATIAACVAELSSRAETEKGILLYQNENFSVYQTAAPYLSSSGRVEIPVTAYNDSDQVIWISPEYCTVNGYTVQGYGLINIVPHSAMIGELDFATEKLNLTSVENLSVSFQWKVLDEKYKVIFLTEERFDYHF
ncbi:MAG: hypothetical protein IJ174_03630 [Clostridia bacterium]|nr:hypothetical protein [Clostridia bacterium]